MVKYRKDPSDKEGINNQGYFTQVAILSLETNKQ